MLAVHGIHGRAHPAACRGEDRLIRGGENVYPRDIEEFLFSHPEVQSAQVFGVPDERLGEEVCAWIVLKPGESAGDEEIRPYCEGRIAHYKVRRLIRFVADFSFTATGKPQKFVMRDTMMRARPARGEDCLERLT